MSTDAYELSPLQQGMLFHWLLDRHAGTDVEQIVADLREHIDPPRLERAWQHALATFSTLRTVFTWEGLSTPLQRIEPRASLRLHFEDFRYLELAERRERLNAYLNADRRDGFDLAQAPLMRVALFQMGDADFRMVWTFHHILIDGRALEIILNHLFAAYENDHQSQIVDRPYREYIEWVVRQSPEAARGFWRDELRGFSATTPLPTDRISREPPRPYDVIETQLPVDVTRRLRELAAREQLSLNTLIMAAWALVLSRHSGESDVIFGATKTTRRGTIADADSLIGLFLATVPVRLAVDADMRVLDWLKQVRDKWVSLRGYEHLPLVEIKQVSPLPPTVPLFESLVVFDRYHFGTGLNAQGGKWANRHFTHLEQTGYALTLTAFGDEPLWWKLEFDARRFKTTTVRRLSGHLLTILSAWSEEASAELWRTPMLPPAERQAIVDDWNATAADYPRSVPLAELLEAGAGRTPYAPAVTYGQETLSYRELNLRANRLARELQKHGIGPGRLVGISVERSLAMLVALLAVTKTGGAYVPLDPAFPTDRIAYMMADSGIQVLMTERRLRSTRPPFSGPVVEVDDETWQSNDDHDLGVQVDSSDPAYVIYTSGSTGKPKGVSVPRVALNNFLWAMRGLLGLDASDRVLAVTTISFDIAGMELWLPLMVGAHIVVASREAAADGRQLTDLLRHHDITFMQCTPVTGRLLLQAGWRGKEDLCLAMGGEALPTDLALALVPRVRRLWNLYGPTETTIWSTADLVGDPNAPISIGRPIANTRCYILDDRRQPVPIGAVGELYIGGDGVAKGYLNRPDLTDERFVLDPFVRGTGARMYRTGDRARFCEDGRIEFLGRNDDQVKIRGFRIELGEIEAVLGQCEGVAAAAVMVQSVPNGDERLVGYVVPKAGAALSFDALRRTLRVSLPEYMIPARFVMLETLPLTPNGKVDRKALPAPEADRQVERQLVEPRNDTERRLAAIWEEVLHIDRIGVHDSFFELGGNSLRAMEVIFRIQASFGAKLPLLRVLQDPTVAAVAAMLEESAAIHAGETAPKARLETGGEIQNLLEPHPAERHAPFPLTDVQEAYWIGRNSAFGIGNVACHVYLEEEIDDLDLDQYERAWQRLIERHDMLRAVVRPDGQQQVLAHTPAFKIPTQDLSDLPAGAAAAAIAATREDLSHQVRPSDRWPLFELRASRLGGNRYRIHLSYDLLIGDAWSFSILRRELDLLYAHPDITLEPLAITFRDYVLATARLRESPDYRRSLAYWDARSATLPARPELPLAKDPGSIEHPRFVRRHDSLDPESTGALRRRAEAFGLTLNGVLLAAYADVLATWSRRPRFLLNLTLFNRLPVHPQVNDLVGDFTSITLLDVELLPAETFLDLARKLLARLWEDLDHRFVSGVQVLRRLAREQPDRLNGAAPQRSAKAYPAPRTVSTKRGLDGSSSSFSLRWLTWTLIVFSSWSRAS